MPLFDTKKTVDQILANFQKTIDDLSSVEDQNKTDADKAAAVIEQKKAEQANCLAEADRAANVRKKLSDLLS